MISVKKLNRLVYAIKFFHIHVYIMLGSSQFMLAYAAVYLEPKKKKNCARHVCKH